MRRDGSDGPNTAVYFSIIDMVFHFSDVIIGGMPKMPLRFFSAFQSRGSVFIFSLVSRYSLKIGSRTLKMSKCVCIND